MFLVNFPHKDVDYGAFCLPSPSPHRKVLCFRLKLYIYVIVQVQINLTREMRNCFVLLFTFCTRIEYLLYSESGLIVEANRGITFSKI